MYIGLSGVYLFNYVPQGVGMMELGGSLEHLGGGV